MNHGVIVALAVLAVMLDGCSALPFARRENRNTAESPPAGENNPVTDNSANLFLVQSDGKGCFVMKEEEVITEVFTLDMESFGRVPKNITYTITVRHCCDGYTGMECDRKLDIVDNIVCGNLTCEADPNAYCAVVKKCGKEIPVFLDENGVPSEKCNQTVDITSLSCTGVCKRDPCLNAECSAFPSATCFPVGCECKAVWLIYDTELGENVEVNCGTDSSNSIRKKRDTFCNN